MYQSMMKVKEAFVEVLTSFKGALEDTLLKRVITKLKN